MRALRAAETLFLPLLLGRFGGSLPGSPGPTTICNGGQVGVAVAVGVLVGVLVGLFVGVFVGVLVNVGVTVGV